MTDTPEPPVEEEREYPPFVILEWLRVGGISGVRIVAETLDEGIAHDVAEGMSRQGLCVWVIDLCDTETGKPRVWEGYDGHGDEGGGHRGELLPPHQEFPRCSKCNRRHAATHPCPARPRPAR